MSVRKLDAFASARSKKGRGEKIEREEGKEEKGILEEELKRICEMRDESAQQRVVRIFVSLFLPFWIPSRVSELIIDSNFSSLRSGRKLENSPKVRRGSQLGKNESCKKCDSIQGSVFGRHGAETTAAYEMNWSGGMQQRPLERPLERH